LVSVDNFQVAKETALSGGKAQARAWPVRAPSPFPAPNAPVSLYLQNLFYPWRRIRGVPVVATADMSAANLARIRSVCGADVRVMPVERRRLLDRIARDHRDALLDEAVNGLWRHEPQFSARIVATRGQMLCLGASAAGFLAALALAPPPAIAALTLLSSTGYIANAAFRMGLVWMGASDRVWSAPPPALPDDALPLYTILVPLHREANIVPALIAALAALDYPPDRLQIVLALEADDRDTIAAVEGAILPPHFDCVFVPSGEPRTKPRACNYALQFARGEFVVIYDAEDRPEPDQLRKAAAAFRAAPETVACFQARLNFYNADKNLLTRLFADDYALWFDYLLPGLERIGIPMPLGGTSNHFRRAGLIAIHGWDPYNVTEDADIGIRLARMGYWVRTLDSTTFEEAPEKPRDWLGQRQRWLKGYMQTWLVHMRHPRRLLRHAGLLGFLGFQCFIGGTFAAALLNPLLWLLCLASLFMHGTVASFSLREFVGVTSLAGLLTGNSLLTYLMMLGPVRRGWLGLAPYGLAAIGYWLMISIAGYRAVAELRTDPWHWHKTPHGCASAA